MAGRPRASTATCPRSASCSCRRSRTGRGERLLRSSQDCLAWSDVVMGLNLNRKVAIGAATLAACAFAGGAYAAGTTGGSSTRQAFLNDAAHRLGVAPQRLKDALAGALQDQLNAVVKAGKLTRAQANAIEQRFRRSGGLPLPLGPGGGPRAFGGPHFGSNGGPLG